MKRFSSTGSSTAWLLGGLVLLGSPAMAQTPTVALAAPSSGLDPAIMPRGIAGAGLNVIDLEAQTRWYMTRLGMKVVLTVPRDGKPYEYVLGFDGGPGAAVLALVKSDRPAGPNRFSRVILNVPNAKALAAHLAANGVASREVAANVAYFVEDPEGNPIELLTPPSR